MATHLKPVALVTGISSGIGRATTQALAAKGYRVFGTSRRATTGATAEGINMVQLDVCDDASVHAAMAHVTNVAGRIDLLVNNAGFGVFGAAEESLLTQARAIFETNVFGVIRMVNAVLPGMRQQGSGRIINMSSVLGLVPSPYMALYAATKHALEGYSESLDHEVRGHGTRVILVEPAYTRTSFEDNMVEGDRPEPAYREAVDRVKALLSAMMDKADDPKIVAEVVLKAAEASTPRLRYTAGRKAHSVAMLRRFAPAFLFDRGIRMELKLDA